MQATYYQLSTQTTVRFFPATAQVLLDASSGERVHPNRYGFGRDWPNPGAAGPPFDGGTGNHISGGKRGVMRNKIPLALLLLLIIVVVAIVGERSIHNGNQALLSRHPGPAVAAQGAQVSDFQEPEFSVASAHQGTTVAETRTLRPRHRGVYRPRRPVAESAAKDWFRVPGTGVALWPKPTG
jgi:hypothetical protein